MLRNMFGQQRFRWGVCIDNMWIYAGVEQPNSTILPYLVSLRLPRGPDRISPDIDSRLVEAEIEKEGILDKDKSRELLCRELGRELKNRHIDFVRCWFQWNFFEPEITNESSNYQYPLDDFVSAMKTSGIEILAVIGNGYSRFLPRGINTVDSTKYIEDMKRMASSVVSHYKDFISVWQIENEPNWWNEHYATHWRSGVMWVEKGIQELVLNALHEVVRNEDPGATIMINLEADNRKTNWSFYSKYCDVLGLDFYPNYIRSTPVDASEVKISTEIKKVTGLPIVVAETGYPSGPKFFGYNETRQAEYVRSACEESFACEDIAGLSLWRYSDSYWKSFPFQENYFGLLAKDGRAKQSWFTFYEQIKAHS